MTGIFGFVSRNWAIFRAPELPKAEGALRFGLFGASNIGPLAIIFPARTHPEVIIAAVAARDEKKAQAYAKKHGIPIVHKSYQDMLDDPSIDAVYIPLPNGLHYEWTIKALKAGKHVLLEKPSTSNATEAAALFRHDILKQPNSPVLLEAFHIRFHPAWQTFLSLLDRPNIASVNVINTAPSGFLPKDDIRFIYDLSGGSLMDLGTYNVLCLRQILGTEPEECIEAIPRIMAKPFDQKCDESFNIKYRFPNGVIGEIYCDLSAKGGWPMPSLTSGLPALNLPKCTVVHREVLVKDDSLSADSGLEHVVVKKVVLLNMLMPHFWHRLDVEETHSIRNASSKAVKKTWKVKSQRKVYSWPKEGGEQKPGEDYWSTYRYTLEEFVNRIKGRKGSGVWMDGEDSIRQMAMIDMAYEKSGLPLRPTSTYK
ncbi:hypothetical protein F5884DRAFT_208323 [Xylogone sp. PMI_703]|nr:hypothetical protein F5884DRAFT_208323 [Xylogone sp. PMI_703]